MTRVVARDSGLLMSRLQVQTHPGLVTTSTAQCVSERSGKPEAVSLFPSPGDSSSIFIAIGSLAGNVSVSASSSRSFICATSAEGDFSAFFRSDHDLGAFFAFVFLVYWMFAPATKGGRHFS